MVQTYDAYIDNKRVDVVKLEDYNELLESFKKVSDALKAKERKDKFAELKEFVKTGSEVEKLNEKVNHYRAFNEQLTIRNFGLETTVRVLAGMVGDDNV